LEITQNTWGEALEIKASDDLLEQSHIRFQGQYYDEETELHYNRYRYYEPYSARYISKDPIGLDGGLNNSTYVSDPMQWVDPLGLQQVDGNFMGNGMADWANSQASKSQTQKPQKPQNNSQGGGILGHLLPGTMSSFARNPQTAHTLKNRQGMRNVGTTGAVLAGAAPYALAHPAGSAISFVEASSTAQIALKGGVVSAGLDGGAQAVQSYMCECNAFNVKQSAGAFVGGTVGGVYTGKMLQTANKVNLGSKAKEVSQVGLLNLHQNLKNVTGQTIWKQSAVIGGATGQMSKAIFTDGETVKKPSDKGTK